MKIKMLSMGGGVQKNKKHYYNNTGAVVITTAYEIHFLEAFSVIYVYKLIYIYQGLIILKIIEPIGSHIALDLARVLIA